MPEFQRDWRELEFSKRIYWSCFAVHLILDKMFASFIRWHHRLHTSQVEVYPGFGSMNQLEVFLSIFNALRIVGKYTSRHLFFLGGFRAPRRSSKIFVFAFYFELFTAGATNVLLRLCFGFSHMKTRISLDWGSVNIATGVLENCVNLNGNRKKCFYLSFNDLVQTVFKRLTLIFNIHII